MPSIIDNLEKLLADGKDTAVLRFSLGNEYLKGGDVPTAVAHLQRAVDLDPSYSAAWKMLGKALAEGGRREDAAAAYRRGIELAQARGDLQAAKEMTVFLRRLERPAGLGP